MADPYPNFIEEGIEDAWYQLLRVYQGVADFQAAYDQIFTEGSENEAKYEELYKAAFAEGSGKPDLTFALAKAWIGPGPGETHVAAPGEDSIGGTFYRSTYTIFKQIGLITGVNVRYLKELQISAPSAMIKNAKDAFQGKTNPKWVQMEGDGDRHEKAAKYKGPSESAPDMPNSANRRIQIDSPVYGTDEPPIAGYNLKEASDGLYFLSPSVLMYLVRKGAKVGGDNDWNKLAVALYNILIAHQEEQGATTTKYGTTAHPVATWTKKVRNWISNKPTIDDIMKLESSNAVQQNILKTSKMLPIAPGVNTLMTFIGMRPRTGAAPNGSDVFDSYDMKLYKSLVNGAAEGYVAKEGNAASLINVADVIIKRLIVSEIGFTDAQLVNRRNNRHRDILAFFGDASPTTDTSQAQVDSARDSAAQAAFEKLKVKKKNLTPTDFQCYLLEQIRKISSQHVSDYKNITKLTTGNQPGLVKNQLSQRYTTAEAEALLTMCPDVQALLVPYLKLWRVDYDDNGKASGEVLLDIPNFINTNDVSNILKRGRLPGAGIKSFTWSLDGVQPAEVDNNISATLEMYFQSVSDFFRNDKEAGTPGYASYLDLVIASPTVSGKSAAADKAAAKAAADKAAADPSAAPSVACSSKALNNIAQKYKGQSYRIKIAAGWADPSYKALKAVGYKSAALLSALKKSKITLFLQQTRHQFKFNENGSLNLTVEYQAALSGMTTSPSADILTPSGNAYIESIKDKEKALKKHKETHKDAETDETKGAYKEMLEELKKLRSEDRLLKYKKFLKKLFESDKIYNLGVNPNELLLPSYSDLTPEDRAQRAKRRKNLNPVIFSSGGARNQVLLDAIATAAEDGGDGETAAAATTEAMVKTYEEFEASQEVIWISYFYLGDLLDLVLEQIKENTERDSLPFSFFLSEVEMIDPLSALQIRDLAEIIRCGQDITDAAFYELLVKADSSTFTPEAGVYELMNIGDIPISIDAFQIWFKNYVVKKDREKYYFLHFVKDICGELITKALSSRCFGPDVKFVQRFDAQPVSYDNKNAASFGPNREIRASSGDNSTTANLSLCREIRRLDHTTSPTDAQLGLVLLGTDSKPKGLSGRDSYGTDQELGVYHNYLGASCGLLKTVNFNREDQPYLREAKIQREGSFSSAQLRELYSAEMEMYGNILYKNGSYVYINPTYIGADEDKLNILGLHGYYLITGVNSTVTENSFNVSVKALHEGISFDQPLLLNPATLANSQKEWNGLAPETAPGVWVAPDGPPAATGGGQSVKREAAAADSEEHQARAKKRMWINRLKAQREEEGWTDEQYMAKMDEESKTYDEAIAAAIKKDFDDAVAAGTPETPTPPEAAE